MRRGLAIIVGLAGLLLLAAWLVPPNLDASRYRGTLEEVASEALGGPARIRGKLAFTLLPLPRLTATDVILGDSGGTAVRAEELRLRVSPWRLLAGHFTAHDLVLRGAELHLPWPPPPGMVRPLAAPWATPFPTRLERARLTLGALALRDITADIRVTETGVELQGSARAAAQDWRITARLGTPDAAGAAGFSISAEGNDRQFSAGLRIDGVIPRQGDATARASLHASDLSQLLPGPAIGVRADGQLRLTGDELRAEAWNLSLPAGTARIDATLAWQPGASLRLAVATPRLDLDPWLPALGAARAAMLPIDMVFRMEAASLGGGSLRQLHGRLGWGETGITLRDGGAILPGEATLALDGTVPAASGPMLFIGTTHLAGDDPRAALGWLENWLGVPFPVSAILPPHGIDIRARVELGPGVLSLSEMSGALAGTTVRGAFGLRHEGQRTTMLADLDLGQVRLAPSPGDLVANLPVLGRALGNLDGDIQARIATLRLGAETAENLAVDAGLADGRLTIRRLAGNALGARFDVSGGVSADGRITDGRVEVNAPSATPLARLLPGAWQATPALWDAPLALRADLSGTADALATRAQVELGDLRVDTQQVMDVLARRGGFRLGAHHPGASRLLSLLGIADPAMPGSLRAWAPGWPGEGSFSLQAQGNWREQSLALDTFQLTAGELRAGGQVTVDAGGEGGAEGPVVTGQVHAETLPLPWPPATATTPLPARTAPAARVDLRLSADQVVAGDTRLAQQAACGLAVARGDIALSACTMQIAGGQASLDARLSGGETPRLDVRFNLDGARIGPVPEAPALGISDATLDTSMTFTARGHSLATLRETAEGGMQLALRDPVVQGIDLPGMNTALADAAGRPTTGTVEMLRTALRGGSTAFEKLTVTGTIARGALQLRDGMASGPAGSVGFQGEVSLADGTLEGLVSAHPSGAPDAALDLRLSGPVDSPARTPGLLRALRWLADRMN